MNYTLRVSRAIFGDLVPVGSVCEAMANAHATGYGSLPRDNQTYTAVLPMRMEDVANDIRAGSLMVRDNRGNRYPNPAVFKPNDVYIATVTRPNLIAWGAERGDTFQIDDVEVSVSYGSYGRAIVGGEVRRDESVTMNTGPATGGTVAMSDATVVLVPASEPLPAIADTVSQAAPAKQAGTEPALVVVVPAWNLSEPKRFQGYAKPLYLLLQTAHNAKQRRPTARDVIDAFAASKPNEIAQILPNGFDYYDAKGDTKGATLAAIGETISRMTA